MQMHSWTTAIRLKYIFLFHVHPLCNIPTGIIMISHHEGYIHQWVCKYWFQHRDIMVRIVLIMRCQVLIPRPRWYSVCYALGHIEFRPDSRIWLNTHTWQRHSPWTFPALAGVWPRPINQLLHHTFWFIECFSQSAKRACNIEVICKWCIDYICPSDWMPFFA